MGVWSYMSFGALFWPLQYTDRRTGVAVAACIRTVSQGGLFVGGWPENLGSSLECHATWLSYC